MKLGQMFPSKYLAASDLDPGQFTPVTIETVDWIDVSMHKDNPDDPDAAYILKFREFKKPMKLNRTNGTTIADVLRTDETDEWIGRRVRIFPTIAQFGGQKFPVIRVDINPVVGATLPVQPTHGSGLVRAPGAASPAPFDVKPVGQKNAGAFLVALAEQGKKSDDFLRWAKQNEPGVYERCVGIELEEWPRGAAAAMQRYLREIPPDTGPDNPSPTPPDVHDGADSRDTCDIPF